MSEKKIVYGMPPIPEERVGGTQHNREDINALIRYVTWLGKHFTEEDNFVCPTCRKVFSPSKVVCPACHPSGPTRRMKV